MRRVGALDLVLDGIPEFVWRERRGQDRGVSGFTRHDFFELTAPDTAASPQPTDLP